MSSKFHHQQIEIWTLGQEFDSTTLDQELLSEYRTCRYRDAVQLNLPQGEGWLFDYGILVGWGIAHHDSLKLLQLLSQTAQAKPENYHFVSQQAELLIRNDELSLVNDDPLQRLAVSHAFAQSAKLSELEDEAQEVISQNRKLSAQLAATGRIGYNRRQLAKLRGTLFETRSDILLHFGLLDTPEFFWDHPELQNDYQQVARYLELTPRTELLNRKLEAIHELVEMLASEQNHKHSSFLEWIIIVLIAVEIVLYFVHS